MSFCRSRGRPRLGGSANQDLEDRTAFVSTKQRAQVSATVRAKTAGNRQNYAVLNRRSHHGAHQVSSRHSRAIGEAA